MHKDYFKADLAGVYITCPSPPPTHTHTHRQTQRNSYKLGNSPCPSLCSGKLT